MAKKELGFEESLSELKSILSRLEDPEIGVDEALKLYESGVKLVRSCQSKLEKIKQKIIYIDEMSEGNKDNE